MTWQNILIKIKEWVTDQTYKRFSSWNLEKVIATYSGVLAWRIPGTGWGILVGCHLWGRTESDTTEVTQQQQQLKPIIRKEIYTKTIMLTLRYHSDFIILVKFSFPETDFYPCPYKGKVKLLVLMKKSIKMVNSR